MGYLRNPLTQNGINIRSTYSYASVTQPLKHRPLNIPQHPDNSSDQHLPFMLLTLCGISGIDQKYLCFHLSL